MTVDLANRMCGTLTEGDATAVEGLMCTSFGELAETGRCGYPRDITAARRFYGNACTKHYQPACNALARLGPP